MRCAVLGDPVAHSLSPVLHAAGYAAVGLEDWSYDAVRVPAGSLAGFVADLDPTWRGLSITAPLKREAIALAGAVTPRARLAGGVNTLVHEEDGWAGDNTDLPGAVAAVRERYDGPVRSALVLGGGATAASIGLAMAELGAGAVTLAVRDASRAAATAATIAAHPDAPDVEVVLLPDLVATAADVVVSTVPVDAQTAPVVAACAGAPVVFEATYHTWPTPLAAAATGVVVSGLDLLVHQALLQFEHFTGVPAPLEEMRRAGEAALAARAQ